MHVYELQLLDDGSHGHPLRRVHVRRLQDACRQLDGDGRGSLLAQPLRFERCRLDGTTFASLDLTGFVFRDCVLTDVDFTEADLRRVDFGGSDLAGARFEGSDLRDADLRGTRDLALDPRASKLGGARLDLDAIPGLLGVFGVDIT